MAAILTAAEMRDVERRAMNSGHVTGLDLMSRAGQGIVSAILAHWPALADGRPRVTVLCGPGNNGGDGFVVARLLALRGWRVRVLSSCDPLAMPADAREMHDRWGVLGPVEPLDEGTLRGGEASDLYVDAIFGLGLARQPEGDVADVISHMGGRNGDLGYYQPRTVAVDAPSGLDLDSGRVVGAYGRDPGNALRASLTVTFQELKPGHLLSLGPALCGHVAVADIGLDPWVRMDQPRFRNGHWVGPMGVRRLGQVGLGETIFWEPEVVSREQLDKGAWVTGGHKYDFGHAVILSGRPGRGGAARMAARGALRIGAGLVTLAVPPAALQENAARLDAVMLRPARDAEALTALLADARLNALCAGPGFGTGEREAAMLTALLDASREGQGRGVVLDADALTLLSRDDALRAKLHPRCVLTPHEGEFARLFPEIDARWRAPATAGPAFSKVDAAREAARETSCVVLLKGPDTVIADSSGRAAINAAVYDRAAPWLATAGSGDVLAGFIAGLLARGFAPFDAACTAAWLHVECARSFGPGLIAEDLPEELPKVFRALGL